MSGLRWRYTSVFALVAVVAWIVSLNHSVPLTAEDDTAAAAKGDDKSASDDENSDDSADKDKDSAKNKKKTAKDTKKTKSRPETAKKQPARTQKGVTGSGTGRPQVGGVQQGAGGTVTLGGNGGGNNPPARAGEPAANTRPAGAKAAGNDAKANTAQNGGKNAPDLVDDPTFYPEPDRRLVTRTMKIQNSNTASLMEQEGVIGTGTGIDEDGNLVIRVYTSGAGKPKIPKTLENVKVETRLGQMTPFQSSLPNRRQRQSRPVPIGCSAISSLNDGVVSPCASGTLGCRLKDDLGNYYALSNNHVFGDESTTTSGFFLGNPCVQPSPGDNLCANPLPENEIGTLANVDLLVIGTAVTDFNFTDSAIIKTTPQLVNNTTPPDGYGPPTSTTVPAFLGQRVQKYGRTTGYTRGIVSTLNVVVIITYTPGDARFIGQIEVIGDPSFASLGAPGDSGSLVVDMNRNPVGLLFAGGGGYTICNPIDFVLFSLGNVSIGGPGGTKQIIGDLSIDGNAPTAPSQVGKVGKTQRNSPAP